MCTMQSRNIISPIQLPFQQYCFHQSTFHLLWLFRNLMRMSGSLLFSSIQLPFQLYYFHLSSFHLSNTGFATTTFSTTSLHAAAETWRRVWGDGKIFRGPRCLNEKMSIFTPRTSDGIFLVIDLVFQILRCIL